MRTKARCHRMITALPFAFVALAPAGCSLLGNRSAYEEAGFSGVVRQGNLEIRDYRELVVVQTTVVAPRREAGNTAFRRLFKYISGHNEARGNIAMTTPVVSEPAKGENVAMTTPVLSAGGDGAGWRYSFILPATYTLETAPLPRDPLVRLDLIPPRKAAVIRYAGRWSDTLVQQKTAELRKWIAQQGLKEVSEPRIAAYDPPWTIPAFRRNEIIIDVK